MRPAGLFIILILAAQPGAAFHQEEEVEHYELERATRSTTTPSPGEIFNITFDNTPEHNHDIVSTDYKVAVSHTAFLQVGTNGVWNVTLRINGQNVTQCHWYIETVDPGGFLTGDLVITPHFTPFCDLGMDIPPGDNTLTLFRSVESGSPDPIQSNVIAVIVSREDIVIMTQDTNFEALTGVTAGEFTILPALVVVGAFLWSRRDKGMEILGALFVLIAAVLGIALYAFGGGWPGFIAMSTLFLIAFGYMLFRTFMDWDTRGEPT